MMKISSLLNDGVGPKVPHPDLDSPQPVIAQSSTTILSHHTQMMLDPQPRSSPLAAPSSPPQSTQHNQQQENYHLHAARRSPFATSGLQPASHFVRSLSPNTPPRATPSPYSTPLFSFAVPSSSTTTPTDIPSLHPSHTSNIFSNNTSMDLDAPTIPLLLSGRRNSAIEMILNPRDSSSPHQPYLPPPVTLEADTGSAHMKPGFAVPAGNPTTSTTQIKPSSTPPAPPPSPMTSADEASPHPPLQRLARGPAPAFARQRRHYGHTRHESLPSIRVLQGEVWGPNEHLQYGENGAPRPTMVGNGSVATIAVNGQMSEGATYTNAVPQQSNPQLLAPPAVDSVPPGGSKRVSRHRRTHSASSAGTLDDVLGATNVTGSGATSAGTLTVEDQFGKRRYLCQFEGCGKNFSTSGHLARHRRLHTGAKPFVCPIENCTSRFNRHDNMLQHWRSHQRKLSAGPSNNSSSIGAQASNGSQVFTPSVSPSPSCSGQQPSKEGMTPEASMEQLSLAETETGEAMMSLTVKVQKEHRRSGSTVSSSSGGSMHLIRLAYVEGDEDGVGEDVVMEEEEVVVGMGSVEGRAGRMQLEERKKK